MCRLYSSPNKLLGSSKSVWIARLWQRAGSRTPNHGAAGNPDAFANIRVQQRRVPQPPALIAGDQSFTLSKQAQLCCVSLQAQYQAFVRFAVGSSTATAIALKRPLRFGTVDRRGLKCLVVSSRISSGASQQTLYRCCGRNVVVPGANSKRFFCVPIGLYRDILRAPTALGMPARSALAGPWGVRLACVIKASIWAAWPWPASTTSAAPWLRIRAAWGIRAR